jgi:hypothetical protein
MKPPVPVILGCTEFESAPFYRMTWDPRFLERSPMMWPLSRSAESLASCAEWPQRCALEPLLREAGITNARGVPLRLVAPGSGARGRYEQRVHDSGELELREGEWHDLFNVLAWLAYPRTKATLNARHLEAAAQEEREQSLLATPTGARNRGRVQDALTVFDESGAIFVSTDQALVEDLRGFRWKSLFWEKRERVRAAVRVCVFGHAMFEKALDPYVGLTAHALPLLVGDDVMREPPQRQLALIDELASARVADPQFDTPQSLAPLPLLGVPGWWPDNEREAFYDDTSYFRPGRVRYR